EVQIQQVVDQLQKSNITNPVKGTVIMKFAEQGEIVSFGKPLYKIADISIMELRVYVSGAQLPEIKLGQKVKVLIDDGKSGYKTLEGEISWISSKAEFTPKIIQTKEERVNLVYAVKVKVANDGSLKIGMPGEIMFK
ncbi:MAG: HlyD family efflux transporter periplasmic adaptor subunit, partial [Ignavibacteriota bacterium]